MKSPNSYKATRLSQLQYFSKFSCHMHDRSGVLFLTLVSICFRAHTETYLFRDLGGNSNSPTEMVSTALREILTTCWHNRLMKSYLHTSSDLHTQAKDVKSTRRTTWPARWDNVLLICQRGHSAQDQMKRDTKWLHVYEMRRKYKLYKRS